MDKQLLKDLCTIRGVSGREAAVREFILDKLESAGAPHEITVDSMGNVIVHLIGQQKPAKKVLFDAHMDEVGFLVSHITDAGYLRFETVGGIDKQVLFGHRVMIGDISGVIGGKAFHLCEKSEREKIPAVEDMVIDIGATNREMAEKLVKVGDFGTFAGDLAFWGNNRFMGKAVDDRVGCALLLGLAEKQPKYDIWISFSTQEEVGLRGAGVVGEAVRPDIAVALDATAAGDIVASTDANCVCRVNGGAVISFADRATVYDVELYHEIRTMAEENGISTQTKNRVAGGNNAGALQRSGNGVRIAAMSLPCRYIHSPSCFGSWSDVEAMEKLLNLMAERLPT